MKMPDLQHYGLTLTLALALALALHCTVFETLWTTLPSLARRRHGCGRQTCLHDL
jgi:hypothetical protein